MALRDAERLEAELLLHETGTRVPNPGSPSFARGLAALGGGRYAVGSQAPAAVHVVDLDRGAVVRTIDLGGEPTESVYAIAALPDAFGDPPDRLASD